MAEQNLPGRILVGVDGSPESRGALSWAADHGVRHHLGLDVLHAWRATHPPVGSGGHVGSASARASAEKLVGEEVCWLVAQGPAPDDVRTVLVDEDPGRALVIESADASLLVVGSHGRGRLAGLVLGSVSQRCIDHATCPVVVVPLGWEGTTSGHVVVGLDGSDASLHALRWGFGEAAHRRVHLDVVHAFDFTAAVSPFGPTMAMEPDELEKASQEMLEDAVAIVAAEAANSPRSVGLVASQGNARQVLLEAAAGADLLVVGSRGRGAIRTIIAGSVAQGCARQGPCPVVVVRPKPAA